MVQIGQLQDQFAIADQVSIEQGMGSSPWVVVENQLATARIGVHGGHVVAFQPTGHKPVLWVSETSVYKEGKAIRGGIPVCWPWFANHPTDSTKPAHGVARTVAWTLRGTEAISDGETRVCLGMTDDERSRSIWPHGFDLELTVIVGTSLRVELTATNTGSEPFTCGGALHTYFAIGSISDVHVDGLDGLEQIDKVDNFTRKRQQGPVRVVGETDSIYLDSVGECTIVDPVWNRRIVISKEGSRTTVIWNPGPENALSMGDFEDTGDQRMICVEAANADDDQYTVDPGEKHKLATTIRVEEG